MPNRMLYDAFPTRNDADAAVSALRARGCAGATSKRLAKAQDGGRLKFGVYAPSRCLAMGLARGRRRGLAAPRVRKTRDEFVVQLHTGGRYGWEDATAADTRAEARGYVKDYRDNQSMPVRLIKRRVRL